MTIQSCIARMYWKKTRLLSDIKISLSTYDIRTYARRFFVILCPMNYGTLCLYKVVLNVSY
jgi:hypothetical protein